MSSQVRDILTVVVLIIVALAAMFFMGADRDSSWVYRFTSGRSRPNPIQHSLSLGKKLLTAMAITFFLTFQNIIHLSAEEQAATFVLACLFMAAGAYSIWHGYHTWRANIESTGHF